MSLISVKWYKVNKVSAVTPLKGLNEAVQKLSESMAESGSGCHDQDVSIKNSKHSEETSRKNLSDLADQKTQIKSGSIETFEAESGQNVQQKAPLKSLLNVDSIGVLTSR